MVAGAALLFEARIVCLVDDDDSQIGEGREDRRARSNDDVDFVSLDPAPLVEALASGQPRMEHGDAIPEVSPEGGDELRSERNFGEEDQRAVSILEGRPNGADVDLGLAASCHAVEDESLVCAGSSRLEDRIECTLLGLGEIVVLGLGNRLGLEGIAIDLLDVRIDEAPLLESLERAVGAVDEVADFGEGDAFSALEQLEDALLFAAHPAAVPLVGEERIVGLLLGPNVGRFLVIVDLDESLLLEPGEFDVSRPRVCRFQLLDGEFALLLELVDGRLQQLRLERLDRGSIVAQSVVFEPVELDRRGECQPHDLPDRRHVVVGDELEKFEPDRFDQRLVVDAIEEGLELIGLQIVVGERIVDRGHQSRLRVIPKGHLDEMPRFEMVAQRVRNLVGKGVVDRDVDGDLGVASVVHGGRIAVGGASVSNAKVAYEGATDNVDPRRMTIDAVPSPLHVQWSAERVDLLCDDVVTRVGATQQTPRICRRSSMEGQRRAEGVWKGLVANSCGRAWHAGALRRQFLLRWPAIGGRCARAHRRDEHGGTCTNCPDSAVRVHDAGDLEATSPMTSRRASRRASSRRSASRTRSPNRNSARPD